MTIRRLLEHTVYTMRNCFPVKSDAIEIPVSTQQDRTGRKGIVFQFPDDGDGFPPYRLAKLIDFMPGRMGEC
jgi:hypothetical protein